MTGPDAKTPAPRAVAQRGSVPTSRAKTLLVMMPALDEAATIESVIAAIPRDIDGIDRVEVLVIDDGSTDDTARLAHRSGASVISHRGNRGVGAALQTGIEEAVRRRVDYAVNIDADGQFDPRDIITVLAPLLAGEADCASASRFISQELTPKMPFAKRAGNWGMARIISSITGQRFYDVSCGFRAYTRETLLQLTLLGSFTYTQEMFLDLSQKGLRIVEVPVAVRGVREHGQSRIASNLFRYGFRTMGIIFSSVRDYSPGVFFNPLAAFFMIAGIGFCTFFIWHRIVAGQFTPHIWAGFIAAFLFGLSILVFSLGQVALMLARMRKFQQQQLYLMRKHLIGREDDG